MTAAWVGQSGLPGGQTHLSALRASVFHARSGIHPFLPSTLARGSAPRTFHLDVRFLRKGNVNITHLGFESVLATC